MKPILIGCNTLYPHGRLERDEQFDVEAQGAALESIVEAGFHGVEYSHIGQLSNEDLEAIAERTAELGLIPWSAHSWTTVPALESAVPKAVGQFRRFSEQAALLAVRVLVVHCDDGRPNREASAAQDINLSALGPLCEAAASFGAKVALENSGSWAEWQYLIELVDRSGIPNLGLNVDTGHANLGDLRVPRAIAAGAHRIATTHLQDNFRKVDDHLPPGEGTIDWSEALSAFLSVGYGGVYMVEISDCPPNREPDAIGDTQRAAENLRRFFTNLGQEVAPPLEN